MPMGERRRQRYADGFDGDFVSDPVADQHGGDARQHHAERRA